MEELLKKLNSNKNYWYVVDWKKLAWYIKVKAMLSWLKIKEYYKQHLPFSYDNMYRNVVMRNRIGKKKKTELDKLFGSDPQYLKLIGDKTFHPNQIKAINKKQKKTCNWIKKQYNDNVIEDG